MSWTAERARYASLTRSRPADDPERINALRGMKAARLADTAESIVAKADEYPPLTPTQREAIIAAFAGFKVGGAAA